MKVMKLEEDLSIRFLDSGVGLDPGSIHLTLDSRKLNGIELHTNNELELSLDLISSRRSQQILIQAQDYLGNSVSRTIQVQAAGPVKIRSALVVPNPNYGNGNLQVSISRAVQAYDLGLYDSSGGFISRFSGGALNSNGRISLEPLLTSNLANGVYLLKLKVTDSSDRTDRKIVKFIILR